jgi:hypothetical protein
MSQEAVEMLLGRLLTDDDLRHRAAATKDLGKICTEEGYLLTPEEISFIGAEDYIRLAMVSGWMNSGIKRSGKSKTP